jgi:hypothetical protein
VVSVLADDLPVGEGLLSEEEYRSFVHAASWDCDDTLPPHRRADRGR